MPHKIGSLLLARGGGERQSHMSIEATAT